MSRFETTCWVLTFFVVFVSLSVPTLLTMHAFNADQKFQAEKEENTAIAPVSEEDRIDQALAAMENPLISNRVLVYCSELEDAPNRYLDCLINTYRIEAKQEFGPELLHEEVVTQNLNFKVSEPKSEIFLTVTNYGAPIVAVITAMVLAWSLVVFDAVRHIFSRNHVFQRLHDWCIDAPPILGISGTLYSLMAFLLMESNFGQINSFLQAFSSAAITTLIGSIVAVLNGFVVSLISR